MEGFIKLERGLESLFFHSKTKYTRELALLWLNYKIAFAPHKQIFKNKEYNVSAGELIFSFEELAKVFKVSSMTVRRWFEYFEKKNIISITIKPTYVKLVLKSIVRNQFENEVKKEVDVTKNVTKNLLVTTDKSTTYNEVLREDVTHHVTKKNTLLINIEEGRKDVIGKKHFSFSQTNFLTYLTFPFDLDSFNSLLLGFRKYQTVNQENTDKLDSLKSKLEIKQKEYDLSNSFTFLSETIKEENKLKIDSLNVEILAIKDRIKNKFSKYDQILLTKAISDRSELQKTLKVYDNTEMKSEIDMLQNSISKISQSLQGIVSEKEFAEKVNIWFKDSGGGTFAQSPHSEKYFFKIDLAGRLGTQIDFEKEFDNFREFYSRSEVIAKYPKNFNYGNLIEGFINKRKIIKK
jgi:DNA-binding transcriptional regulator YhcF (GntR family)